MGVEATPGWLEPLLARIAEDRRRVVVPSIDSIDAEDFKYTVGGLSVLSFSWTLGQRPLEAPKGDEPARSSVMAGGLFAADRAQFLRLGGYDPEMKLYGGEEMEIGFRTWQCGGSIEYVPCSHIGHVFRTGKYWQGQVYKVPYEEIVRNKLRAAEVWMDEFKDLVRLASSELPAHMTLEPLGDRARLREKLRCQSFEWFLGNVATEVRVPKVLPKDFSGSLSNVNIGACIDTLGKTPQAGEEVGSFPCHGQHGTQAIRMDPDGRVYPGGGNLCMAGGPSGPVFRGCDAAEGIRWRWSTPMPKWKGIGQMVLLGTPERCLEAENYKTALTPYRLVLRPCRSTNAADQLWTWEP